MKTKRSSRLLAVLIALVLTLSMIPSVFAEDLPFTDVPADAWYYDNVAYAYENKLMNGMTTTTFGPDGTLTRAMVVTVLYRLDGEPNANADLPFTDVAEDAYYTKAVQWGVENEIVKGLSTTTFGPDANVTREQLATFMYRYAEYAGKDLKPAADLTTFPDSDKVQTWSADALTWAVGAELVNGVKAGDKTYLNPGDTTTRAQVAAILQRFVEKVGPAKEFTTLQLFETTDIHGYIAETSAKDEKNYQYRMAYLAQVYNNARADEAIDDVIVLDAGDIYQGTPLSNLTYGNAIRAALDAMEYDAVCLGNHEFDWDVGLYAATDGTIPAYKMGDHEGDSDIPVLAYNLYDAGTTNRASIVDDYVILRKDHHKIAVIGYVPDYSAEIMAAKIAPYDIDGEMEKLAALVEEVNATEKPSVTIVLAHASPAGIARAMDPEQVDLVLGGHSHGTSNGVADNGIAYGQGGCWAKGYATTTITINNVTGDVSLTEPTYVSIIDDVTKLYNNEENAANLDPTVLDITVAAIEGQKEVMNEVLGYVDMDITRSNIPGAKNSIAGNWMTSLMLDATKDLGTIIAFTNSGGIRCDLLMEEGEETRDITVGDIYQISPFANHLMTYDLTGAQLAQTIKNALGNGNFGNQMNGLVVTYYRDADRNFHIVSIVLDDGTEVDINDTTTTYRVVTNEYCATLSANGVDAVYKSLTPIQDINAAPIDNQAAIESLKAIAAANDGYLPLDATPRCIQVEAPAE